VEVHLDGGTRGGFRGGDGQVGVRPMRRGRAGPRCPQARTALSPVRASAVGDQPAKGRISGEARTPGEV